MIALERVPVSIAARVGNRGEMTVLWTGDTTDGKESEIAKAVLAYKETLLLQEAKALQQ